MPQSQLISSHRRSLRIGCLAGWQVYDGVTLEHYLHLLMQGVVAAAEDHDCDLLLACGVGPPTRPYVFSPAWFEESPDSVFVPVGPQNCDGLIVIPPLHIPDRMAYVHRLITEGFPVVFAGADESGPTVGVDNAAGIHAAVQHLVAHGHHAIAFISGREDQVGDSAERLQAFYAAMEAVNLAVNRDLVRTGSHSVEHGNEAMQALLYQGIPFSAVIASNDHSAFGALTAIRADGRRVPDDIALVGFDDVLESRVQAPPLTTIHHSPFDLGYQALVALLDLHAGRWDGRTRRNIPVRLVARQSCGCRPGMSLDINSIAADVQSNVSQQTRREMINAVLGEARQQYADALSVQCDVLSEAFFQALSDGEHATFQHTLVQTLRISESLGEDVSIWHTAILILQQVLPALPGSSVAQQLTGERMLGWAHLTISERTRRQVTRTVLRQVNLADRVGTMTAQLLDSLDHGQTAATLAHHLTSLGIGHLLVALYEAEGEYARAWCRVVLSVGLEVAAAGTRFPTSAFPPETLYPPGQATRLAILPLEIEGSNAGFVAFAASNLAPCATIVRNLASALRTNRLYHDAAEGRRLAEEASQLKTRFLSMVSHELRTPLNVIVGLSEMLLRDKAATPPGSTLHADLERVYASAQHLGQLIGDVLDLTSSDAGQLRLVREPIDISEVLQMVVAVGEQMARAKGLDWQADLPQTGPHILGDRTRLRQIVLNLVSNAVKFTAHGRIKLALTAADQRAIITVSDTGIGVIPAEQELIFDVFRRSGTSTEGTYGGLGLGLAICRQLVDLHGGTISVRSSGITGEGSVFTVELPCVIRGTSFGSHMPHDLLVIAEHGKVLASQLRAQGYAVRVLDDPTSVQDNLVPPPGAILLDTAAARHGAALTGLLQSDPRLAHIPLLVWGEAQAGSGALVELNLLPKPISPSRLAQAVLRTGLSATRGYTVLIVDDTPSIRALHCRIISEALPHAQIIEAADGRAALHMMEHQIPDLVLLDLMMPELDGFGVLEAMRSDPRTHTVPVLVLTARPLDSADMARLQHGVAAILAKGLFSVEETIGHIMAAIQRQRRLNQQTRRLMHQVLAFIHEHFAEPLSRDVLAAHVGVNENYLSECFRAEMGVSPMSYLTRYRINRACAMLDESDASITAVAEAVGFSDSAYFSRVFQREMGMRPRDYRRRIRES